MSKVPLVKRNSHDDSIRTIRTKNSRVSQSLEVGLAAILCSQKQKEVYEFTSFILDALERHSYWLNAIIKRLKGFKCALLVGAGRDRFQLKQTMYPNERNDISLEIELKESDDYNKLAITALVKMNRAELNKLYGVITARVCDNELLKNDLLKGKALGISFAILQPITDKIDFYRVQDLIVINEVYKTETGKKRREEHFVMRKPFKRVKY